MKDVYPMLDETLDWLDMKLQEHPSFMVLEIDDV